MEHYNELAPFPVYDTSIIADGYKLLTLIENMTKSDYNSIPVKYCKNCLSLKIQTLEGANIDYCGVCGDSEIAQDKIEIWNKQYKKFYGTDFITRNKSMEKKK